MIEVRLGDEDGSLFDERSSAAEVRGMLEELDRDLAALSAEAKIDADLLADREEIVTLGRKVQARNASSDSLMQVLMQIIALLDALSEKRKSTMETVAALEKGIDQSTGRNAVLDKVRSGGSCIEMLGKLLEAGRGPSTSEAFKRRVSDRHVKIMMRNIDHRRARVAGYENSIKTAGEQIQQVRDKLWREHQVSLPPYVIDGEDRSGARAEGVFDEGIILCAWKHLVETGKPGERGMVRSVDSQGQRMRYIRSDSGAITAQSATD